MVDGDLNQDFTFQVDLTDLEGNVLTGEYQYVGSKTGSISSGETITLSNGQTVVINALPVNANYTVTEIDAEVIPPPFRPRFHGSILGTQPPYNP